MSGWTQTLEMVAVKLPSGSWVRTDRVDAVEERHGDVYVILSCGQHVKANFRPFSPDASGIAKLIWEATDD